ncbi:MAG: terminase large subunit [Planctomycetaceae bacterium]|nr:terminase large subunit [Planctomycetaceae bacterium]
MIRDRTIAERVEDYCQAVESGDIIACKSVKQAIARVRRDCSRLGDPDFPFTLSENRGSIACEFFPALLKHSIGEHAGSSFHLADFQQFILFNLFGWIRDDGTRRFRKMFLSVARKNGKSTFCAGLAILLGCGDGEPGSQVFIGATKMQQAKIIFEESKRMIKQSPAIAKHSTILRDNISFDASDSFIRPLGSDKSFDGLNPQAMFFDEIHAFRPHNRGFFDTMTTGSGSRRQPMQVIITTASDERGYLYHEEADYCRGVVAGDFIDEALFGMIFELDESDDAFDPDFDLQTLKKSNPGLNLSVNPDYLKLQLEEAINKPAAKNRFLRYHANICVSSQSVLISSEEYEQAAGELSDWSEAEAFGAGIDLGGRDDLCSYAIAARFKHSEDKDGRPIYRYEVRSKSFIGDDCRRDLNLQPFQGFVRDGLLTVTGYPVSVLQERLIEDCIDLGVEYVAFDPFSASHLAENLTGEGLKAIKCPQSHLHFNEVIEEFFCQIVDGRFRPDINDRILKWAFLNMGTDENAKGQKMPTKGKNSEDQKIDPAVATLMAIKACKIALPKTSGSLVL